MAAPGTFVLTALVISTSGLRAQEQLPVEEMWRTDGAAEGLELKWVTDAWIDGDARVWILDEYSAGLSVWDWPSPEAPPRTPRAVSEGIFEGPVRMAGRREGGVAVLDAVRRSVFRISGALEVESEVSLGGIQLLFPKDLLVLEDGRFVVLSGSMQGTAGLRLFSRTGTLLREALDAEPVGDDRTTAMVAGGVGVVSDDRLIVSLAQKPGLHSFDISNGRTVLLDPMERLFPSQGSDFVNRSDDGGQVRFSFRWFFTRPTALMRLPSGLLLHVVTDQEGDRGIWELRRPDGVLVRRFSAAAGYRPLAYVRDGVFLAMHLDPASREQVLVGLRLPPEILE